MYTLYHEKSSPWSCINRLTRKLKSFTYLCCSFNWLWTAFTTVLNLYCLSVSQKLALEFLRQQWLSLDSSILLLIGRCRSHLGSRSLSFLHQCSSYDARLTILPCSTGLLWRCHRQWRSVFAWSRWSRVPKPRYQLHHREDTQYGLCQSTAFSYHLSCRSRLRSCNEFDMPREFSRGLQG